MYIQRRFQLGKNFTRRTFISTSTGAVLAGTATTQGNKLEAPRHKTRIKVGQIGTGHGHAGGKMRALRENPDFEVVGIVESNPEYRRSAKKSEIYQGVKWMEQDQLLATKGLQVVAVETDVPLLLDTAEACVDAGLHIHLDKPGGSSLPHFSRILEKTKTKNLIVQMGYMFRYNPGVVLMRDLVKKGWLGEPFEMRCVMSKLMGPGKGREENAWYSGGTMFELGGHMIDTVVKILGVPDRVTPFLQRLDPYGDGLGLADNTLAVFEYPKALAEIKVSLLEVEGGQRRHITLCGTEGTLHIQPMGAPQGRLALLKPHGKYKKGYQQVDFPPYPRYVDDIEDLAAMVRGERENRFTPEHDLMAQETLLHASGMPTD